MQHKCRLLARVRAELGPGVRSLADEVLLHEVDHYLPTHSVAGKAQHFLQPREQWFGFRLLGLGDGDAERRALADRLRAEWSHGDYAIDVPRSGPARRSEQAGARRNAKRRSRLTSA
jgi:hypothetical protein